MKSGWWEPFDAGLLLECGSAGACLDPFRGCCADRNPPQAFRSGPRLNLGLPQAARITGVKLFFEGGVLEQRLLFEGGALSIEYPRRGQGAGCVCLKLD